MWATGALHATNANLAQVNIAEIITSTRPKLIVLELVDQEIKFCA
jgi:hypothetical protein